MRSPPGWIHLCMSLIPTYTPLPRKTNPQLKTIKPDLKEPFFSCKSASQQLSGIYSLVTTSRSTWKDSSGQFGTTGLLHLRMYNNEVLWETPTLGPQQFELVYKIYRQGCADLWWFLLYCKHHSGGDEGSAVAPLPVSAQEEEPGEEAAGYLLQSHQREHPGVLRHSVVYGVLSRKQYCPKHHRLLSSQPGGHHQLSLPQQSWQHHQWPLQPW